MADSKSFLSPKDLSSRSSDQEYSSVYSAPTQESGHGERSSSSVPAFAPAHPESTTAGATFERTPSPVPKPSPQSEPASRPEQDSQPVDNSAYVYGKSPPRPHPKISTPADAVGQQDVPKGNRKCTKVSCALLLPVLCGFIILGVIGEIGIMYLLPSDKEQDIDTHLADLMANDTILLYQGNSSAITISEVLPASSPKPDVSLYVTECTDLIEHTRNRSLTDLSLNFTSSNPVSIPSTPLHYEQGSTLSFAIRSVDASKESTLDLLMFDNATKAKEYSRNPNPETGAQAIRHWTIDIQEEGNSTHITFMPSYGSYFIPVLSPVPSLTLNIELSYVITQVFYFHADYAQYTNCSLDMKPCSLTFSTGNESCVLAYLPLSSEKVTLQMEVVMGEEEHSNDHLLLSRSLIGAFIGVSVLAFFCVLIALICICTRNKPAQEGYTPLSAMNT